MSKDPKRPPSFRGVDFLMRFQQGKWSEERIIDSINNSKLFGAVPYGRSQVFVGMGKEEIQEYWEEYCKIETHGKRPDILVFNKEDMEYVMNLIGERDPTTMSEDEWSPLLPKAICGIEAENSLWRAAKMPDRNATLPLRRKSIIAPNVWVKQEDLPKILEWKKWSKKPVYVVQVFYDEAYAQRIRDFVKYIQKIKSQATQNEKNSFMKKLGLIITTQSYTDQRIGVATKKEVYRLHPRKAIFFGNVTGEPKMESRVLESDNGKIMPFIFFSGGNLELSSEIISEWKRFFQTSN